MALHGDGAGPGLTNASAFVQSNATFAGTNASGTIASNGISVSVGNYLTTAMLSNANTSFVNASAAFAGTNASGTIASNGISVSVAAGAGDATLSVYYPYRGFGHSTYSSHDPASFYFQQVVLPTPLAMSQVIFGGSISVGVPGATSQNSTGTARYSYSNGLTLFKRVDFGANSSVMTTVATGSYGLTAGISYSSTSQSFAMSWVTDSAGGTSNYGTTSNAANWSSVIHGARNIAIPMVTTLSQGEYFMADAMSSSSATTQSNVTFLSVSRFIVSFGSIPPAAALGKSADTQAGVGGFHGWGRATAVTTNNTMALSVITNNSEPPYYVDFQNLSTPVYT